MQTKRQLQVASLIKRQFSAILLAEGSYIYDKALVTVTNVYISPDFGLAKIYLSVYNTDNKQEVLLNLEHHHQRLKQQFGSRLRKHMRRIPDFDLYLDDTLDEMYRLNALFDRLQEENQMGSDGEE
ncbi:MAG: ribosome-binding factor A [Saprospiraceae bacterium]|nr:ribosome-binding factor A [Saprospiraceae bacterium]